MPDQPRAFLVLPTYNERDNLPLIVAALQALPISLHILIVDDGSPDGTGAVADELAAAHPRVQVIHRPGKLGLGTAYTAGFQAALAQGAELILTMDADFSHDPSYVPALIEASRRFDLVIGSRYIPGGGVRHWGPQRRALSRGANAIAHRVLGLKARDCTAGFRCYRRAVLETINPATIRADGYSYLIEMLFRCQRAGFNIGEVPIIFADRRLGRSKISQHEILKAALTVLRLSYRRIKDRSR
ncbi:MAG: polyprenol monophosphomannose synthase [Anaerolineae bacterium]|nr:polyprenol monophosphomannose synthase [Anaerolineae bacterium]